ncbi:MAG: hypothetical protein WC213_03355 [Arenimonas sp.]
MFLIALAIFAGLAGSRVALSTILAVQTALVAFAGLVVTIFGIWIAVIFPAIAQVLTSGVPKGKVPELARYDVLVRALYRSCFSLCSCFFVFLVLSFYSTDGDWLVVFSVFFSWLAFWSIVLALWSAVWTGESAVVNSVNESMRSGLMKRLRSLGRSK